MTPRTRARLRRERLRPDTRPKWNDPDLQCGHNQITAEEMSFYADLRMRFGGLYDPHWRSDPTYDLCKKENNPALAGSHLNCHPT